MPWTPLRLTGLSRRAINVLARCQVHAVGELLALPPAQVRAIHAIGTKTASDIIAFQEALLGRGVAAATVAPTRAEPPLVPDLSPIRQSRYRSSHSATVALRSALAQADLPTVGVAALTRTELLEIPGSAVRSWRTSSRRCTSSARTVPAATTVRTLSIGCGILQRDRSAMPSALP